MLFFFVIVFGFLNAPEITLEEQGKAILLPIGFIKGENVQTLTDIDSRNTGRFSLTITGTASMWKYVFRALLFISQHEKYKICSGSMLGAHQEVSFYVFSLLHLQV